MADHDVADGSQIVDLVAFRKGVERLTEQGDPRAGRAAELLTALEGADALAYGVSKAAEEKRFTFGPLYVPDSLDAHKEFARVETLQKAVWDYVRSGDREIRLQHLRHVRAGEWVELSSWPYESEVALSVPGTDEVTKVTLPAGTPYMGVIWDEPAWELVKAGKLRGLSIGGRTERVLADFAS